MKKFVKALALATSLSLAAIGSANAAPITYWFNGTLTDGSTASGQLTLNVSGFPSAPTSITSSSGLFAGYTYALPADPVNLLNSASVLVLSSPTYNRYLYLDFSKPLTQGGTDDLIAASSFECNGYGTTAYACTGNASNVRYFSSGTAVPEPFTLSLFAAGLLGLAIFGRGKVRANPSGIAA